MKIGVLALQGDFSKHLEMLSALSVSSVSVKTPFDLAQCDALIIPGGESTTLSLLLRKHGLGEELKKFGLQKPVFGTCAGAILICNNCDDPRVEPYNFIDISVSRNAYGRQKDSFVTSLFLDLPLSAATNLPETIEAFFIRAPKITKIGPQVKVLASYQDKPVLVQSQKVLAATFHPELSADLSVHQHFVNMVRSSF